MADFDQLKRERYLDEASYLDQLSFAEQEAIPEYVSTIQSAKILSENLPYTAHHLHDEYLTVALFKYSGGRPVDEVRQAWPLVLSSLEDVVTAANAPLAYVDLAIQNYYVEALWLLSLTKLLGFDNGIQRVSDFYLLDETNSGADELFEALLAKLGLPSSEAEGLIHEEYQHLLGAIKAEPNDRPAHMQAFLRSWYNGMRDCGWWGSHVRRPGTTVIDTGFFGYWAFEAGLVTYLWDIDDSSYREMQYYPKDLVDYAHAYLPK